MADDKREPDITDDPGKAQVADEGLPEENPAAGGSGPPTTEGIGSGREPGSEDAPVNNPSGGHRESPPSKATGNPDAAGP